MFPLIWFGGLILVVITALVLARSPAGKPFPLVCGKCSQAFENDGRTSGPWVCPHCSKKNPNLRRHYRSIAALVMVWVFNGGFFLAREVLSGRGYPLIEAFALVHLACGVVAIVAILWPSAPWADTRTRALVWLFLIISLLLVLVEALAYGSDPVYALPVRIGVLGLLMAYLVCRCYRAATISPGLSGPQPVSSPSSFFV